MKDEDVPERLYNSMFSSSWFSRGRGPWIPSQEEIEASREAFNEAIDDED